MLPPCYEPCDHPWYLAVIAYAITPAIACNRPSDRPVFYPL